ncbi:MAG TPA: c-type cytochrome [Usitatibacter sp.]|nr:c-type cytochrome [Usitatibacter sp.]
MLLVYASLTAAAESPAPPKPDLARGQQIATTVCAACHSADGNSVNPTFPVLAGQHADYIVAQLTAFKSGARPNPIMQGMAAGLSPEDMRNVAAWFESRKPLPHFAHDKLLVERGQQIWRGGVATGDVPACAGCHGAAGHGIPAQFPRLAGQYPDLSFAWLRAFAAGTRPNSVMGPIASKLSENDMKALAEYISGLR